MHEVIYSLVHILATGNKAIIGGKNTTEAVDRAEQLLKLIKSFDVAAPNMSHDDDNFMYINGVLKCLHSANQLMRCCSLQMLCKVYSNG